MTDLSELMKQAQKMQQKFQQKQQDLADQTVDGESGAGLVKVTMNGRHDVVDINLDNGLLNEEKEVVEDLIAAAFNDAVRKLEEKNKETLSAMTEGLNLPEGFKLPF